MQRQTVGAGLAAILCLMLAFAQAAPRRTREAPAKAQEPPPQTQTARSESLRVSGAVEKPGEWTTARLTKEFAGDLKTVSYTRKGVKGEARCLPLIAFLEAARPRVNPKIKNHTLAFVAFVRGGDGYTAAFSLGELLPQYGKRSVWLALEENGKPLGDREAPVALLSPDDGKPSRWVHGVASIAVVDGLALAKDEAVKEGK